MTKYHSNLKINNNTSVDELVEYTRTQLQSPITMNGVTIYNLSTHKPDFNALNHAVQTKLTHDIYVIPIQVTTANIFIYSILPEQLQESEILLYRQKEHSYYAYNNFLSEVSTKCSDSITTEFTNIIE